MREHQDNDESLQLGDKVRLKSGPHEGARGVIQAEIGGTLEVTLDNGDVVQALPEDITNYSSAARRAWKAMPKRTGRPKGQKPVKRLVSMRLDVDILDMLREAIELGLLANREKTINDWIRERASSLLSAEKSGEESEEVQSCQDTE